jgi:beta-RFAP synthase
MLSVAPELPDQPPDAPGATCWPRRRFGGVGLMVEAPGVCVAVEPADTWSAEGPLARRALEFARLFARTLPPDVARPQRVVVEHSSSDHTGLGTGTQLGLAVARALAVACGQSELDALELARRIGRGRRSALGIHGFAHGGFLVEGGQGNSPSIAPLVARLEFPQQWRLVLVLPPWGRGLHGNKEAEIFQMLKCQPREATDALCGLVLLGMLPALRERDLPAFGESLFEFNTRVGKAFAPFQGGCYGSPRTEEIVQFVRRQGVKGVAQSSWGPTVSAVVADSDRAMDLARRLRQHFQLEPDEVLRVRAANRGATVSD